MLGLAKVSELEVSIASVGIDARICLELLDSLTLVPVVRSPAITVVQNFLLLKTSVLALEILRTASKHMRSQNVRRCRINFVLSV